MQHMLPFQDLLRGTDCVFQQDNASIHTSRSTKDWFSQQNVQVLDWPALNQDLNPIENIRCILTRQVYPNGKQYSTVEELQGSIEKAWYSFRQ